MTTAPPADPSPRALSESLAALAGQLADLRGQVCAIKRTAGSGRAPRRPEPGRPVRGSGPDCHRRPRHRRSSRADRAVLDRPGPRHLPCAAGRPAPVGRRRAPPALRRLRVAGLLAPPHPCRLGTVHPSRRMAPYLQRDTSRPGPGPRVPRPLAARHHAAHRGHHPHLHAEMRHAPQSRRLACSSGTPLMPAPRRIPYPTLLPLRRAMQCHRGAADGPAGNAVEALGSATRPGLRSCRAHAR